MNLPTAELSGFTFCVLGDKQNERDSYVVVRGDYTKDGKNQPIAEGVQDAHMGSYGWDECPTCKLCGKESYTGAVCPGHYGSYHLNYPVLQPLFIPEIVKWLKVVCHYCGSQVVAKDVSRVREDLRLAELAKARQSDKVLICNNVVGQDAQGQDIICGKRHLDVRHDRARPTIITRVLEKGKSRSEDRTETLLPETIYRILERVKPATLLSLGKNEVSHPSRFVLHTVRMPPNTIRPDMLSGGTKRMQNDDLTLCYRTLINADQQLPEGLYRRPEKDAREYEDAINNLNLCFFGVIKDADKAKLGVNNNRKMTSLVARWKGKPGRIRRNLLGRRVVHISRSFITCDNSLRYYEVGVPIETARTQGVTVAVQPYNYEECLTYYLNGTRTYPGATKVIQDGQVYDVEKRKQQNKRLEIGDLLTRNIVDGDAVGFNRQPSLEPSSVSCFRVVVYRTGDTFRLNVSTCNLFNADFDGDAMHLIWMNRLSTADEMWHLAGVPQFFISYKNGAPKLGEVQDAVAGLSRLTMNRTLISTYHAMGLFADADLFPSFLATSEKLPIGSGKESGARPLLPGRDVVSALLRHLGFEISYRGKPSIYHENFAASVDYDPKDIRVEMERGVLRQGILDAASVGQESSGGLFHIVHNKYGAKAAMDLAHYLQLIGIRFIMQRGITIGIKDMVLDPASMRALQREEAVFIQLSREITQRLDRGKIVPPIGMTIGQRYEAEQLRALKDQPANGAFWPTVTRGINPETNQFYHIVMTGAKGKAWNLLSVIVGVGQLTMDGQRMAETFNRRGLLYFTRYDPDPEARGYVPNSYLTGLSVPGFCYHAMDSRTTIVRRALSTAVTGHQSRRGIKSLETSLVDNHRRTSNGQRIVQQLYGGDGVDPRAVEKVALPTMDSTLSTAAFELKYRARPEQFPAALRSAGLPALLEKEYKRLLADRANYREIVLRLVDAGGLSKYSAEAYLAINMQRIIQTVRGAQNGPRAEEGKKDAEAPGSGASVPRSGLDPVRAILAVREFCKLLPYTLYNTEMRRRRVPLPDYARTSCTLVLMHVRSYLNCAEMLRQNISDGMLEAILESAGEDYARAMISYGKTVGNLAAQSLSEPMTQLVLDSHHGAGAGSTGRDPLNAVRDLLSVRATHMDKNKRRGTVVAEVENKVMSGMTLQVMPPFCYNKAQVQMIANELEMVDLRRFVAASQILYEEYGRSTHPLYQAENALVAEFNKYFLQPATEESRAVEEAQRQKKKTRALKTLRKDRVAGVPHDLTRWCIRLQLDKQAMVEKQMTVTLIVLKLRSAFPQLWVVHSPENAREAVVRLYLRDTTIPPVESVNALLRAVLNQVIRGVEGIKSTSVETRNQYLPQEDGSLKEVNHYYISTVGSNLVQVMEHPRVDTRSCQSTSLPEMLQVYGVMVTRAKLTYMLKRSIEKVSFRHYMLYADEMTFHGTVTAINNFGSAKRGASPLLQISDEQPLKVIINSAVNSAKDNLDGISGPILLGKTPRVGDMYNTYVFNSERARLAAKSLDSIIAQL